MPYLLSFEYPLLKVDTNKIAISNDTLKAVKYEAFFKDSSKTKVEILIKDIITKSVLIKAEKGAFINYLSDSSSSFTLNNPMLNSAELGLIAGDVEKVDSSRVNYIIQLIKDKGEKVEKEVISENGKFEFTKIAPGTYSLKASFIGYTDQVIENIKIKKGDILVFKYLGFKPKEFSVGEQTNIDVKLEEDASQLDEVVVIGYTSRKKGDITGSVSTLKAENIAKSGSKDLVKSYSHAGAMHVLAVSGLHVGILYLLLSNFLNIFKKIKNNLMRLLNFTI